MSKNPTINDLTRRNIETVAKMERASNEHRTLGERVADIVAATVGSWPFIIIQTLLLVAWMVLNVVGWINHWDPYPFILLNLALSFQAAYASPIIMMSQNRQARLNERQHKLDLQINLLAEQENTATLKLLRLLCEKLGIDADAAEPGRALEEATHPEEMVRQIERIANAQKKTAKQAQG